MRRSMLAETLAAVALGIAVAAGGALWAGDGSGSVDPDRDPGPDKEDEEERLMTRIDGEEARLLVHIERLDNAPEATDDRDADPPSLRE